MKKEHEQLEIIRCENGVGEWEIHPTGETFDTMKEAEARLTELVLETYPDYVDCRCGAIYREGEPVIKVCPECGNTDMKATVYLQPDEDNIRGFINMVKGI